jgi:hypothetical protein
MNVLGLFRAFCDRYPQAEFPPSFYSFLEEQERLGHAIRRANGQPLAEFLKGLDVPAGALTDLLDADSHLAVKVSYPDLLRRSPKQVDAYISHKLGNVFLLQEIVLDSETVTGFNRHGRDHLGSVTRRMENLLRYAAGAPTAQVEKEVIIAGYLHDVGNLLSRKEHGLFALYLLTQLFTDVDRDAETLTSFLRVMEAVLFHEVEYGSHVASLEELSPLTLALIVADKTDVNFERVSSKSNMPEAIRDAHTLVNLLTGASRLRLKKSSLAWEIHFTPKMRPDRAVQFPALIKRAERVWVPSEWQKLYRRENIEYIFIFQATFLRVYFTRLSFAVRALFALVPQLETFQLVFNDDERGMSLTRVFGREDYQDKLNLIANNLFKNEKAS